MQILINLFGIDVRNKQAFQLDPERMALREVVKALDVQEPGLFRKFVREDLSPVDGTVVLVNGRNILSLAEWDTQIQEGDEISFLVPVAGG
jgi:molybdopterin converting factor small subunit